MESRRGNDWVDQMPYGGVLKCAEHGYRMLFDGNGRHLLPFEFIVRDSTAPRR
nr:hypothetical protein [Sphingomonas psychrotolerans]